VLRGDRPGVIVEEDDWRGLRVRRLSFNILAAPVPYRFEWDNPWVGQHLLEYAAAERADVVHVVHGGHLSMAAAPRLRQAGPLVVASVLDYWHICTLSTLKRVTGRLCLGPDRLGGECVRCVLTRPWTLQDRASRLVRRAPNLALKALAVASRLIPNPPGRWATVEAQTRRLADMRAYLAGIDAVLCPSEFVAGLLHRNGFDPRNIRMLPLGIQPPDPQRARPAAPADRLRIGFLGRLEPSKGAHVLVEAFGMLPADLAAELLIYGTDDAPAYADGLRARAAGDPRVRFLGGVASPFEALCQVDTLVVPSVWYEGFPLAVRDAQALGLPVLVSDIGGVAEGVRADLDGLHFRAGDPRSLALQLRRLVDDPQLLQRLRAGVRPPLTTAEHVEQLLALYAELRAGREASALATRRWSASARLPIQ
jgi:glycosyltransferase involved in cell wall biosynthesis